MDDLSVLSQNEVLNRLGVNYKTLIRLEGSKKLRVVRINRKVVRYFVSDVEKLISEVRGVN